MPAPPPVRRRTAVAGLAATGVVATGLVAGCDSGDDIASSGPTSASPTTVSPTAAPSSSPTGEPSGGDEGLVDDVLAALGAALAVLAEARRVPTTRTAATALLRAHRRHLLALEGDLADVPTDGSTLTAADAVRRVRRSEQTLRLALTDAAGRAESGALARLLASMAASVSQHLTLLPTSGATP